MYKLMVLMVVSFGMKGQNSCRAPEQIPFKVMNSIWKEILDLPNVIEDKRKLDSLSNHTKDFAFHTIYTDSTKSKIEVIVFEYKMPVYFSHFIFYLDAKTLEILNPDGKP